MRSRLLLAVAVAVLGGVALILPVTAVAGLWDTNRDLALALLVELRLPRALLALGYGATLGVTGASLQALFANPLASPDITGGSTGAALGAVVGGYWLGLTGPLELAFCGALGAGLALLLLLLAAGRDAGSATLLLAGLAISLAGGALTSLALALAPSPFAFYDSFDWLMGSLVDRSLPQAAAALLPAGLACALLLRRTHALDSLALGDDVTASLGHRLGMLRMEVVALSATAVGVCVAVCGAVGFVGLVAPVFARKLSGGHPGRAMAPAALIGAALMTGADLITRLAPLGRTIPLGVVTAAIGTPIFLWIVVSMRWRLSP